MGIKLGEGKKEDAQNTFRTITILVLTISAMITILGINFNYQIAGFLGANDVLLEMSAQYIKVLSIFAVPMCLMFLFGFSLRILGKPDLYFKGSILSVLVNIILNYTLIYKLRLGTTGAAIATGLAYSSAFIIVVRPMFNRKNIINIYVGKFDLKTVYPVCYNGSSEGINSIATALYTYLFNMALMGIAGEAGVSAFTAINYIAQFGLFLMFGIADGMGPIISYNYGAGEYKRVAKLLKIAGKMIFIMGCIIFSVMFVFGRQSISIFIKDNPQIIEMATSGGKLYAIAFFMNGFNIAASGYFTAIGDALSSVVVAASRGIIFLVIGINILPVVLGISGIWLSVAFAEMCTIITVVALVKKSKKSKYVNDCFNII